MLKLITKAIYTQIDPDSQSILPALQDDVNIKLHWHGWMGHDPDIMLPHVPGHEMAGVVEAVGKHVVRWKMGDRVTLPFVCGCGACSQCMSGNQQVCDNQFQPGFTHY